MFKNKFLSFIIFGIITYSASFIGAVTTFASKEPWYSELSKPTFTAPDWLFGPVWTILYLFMTIAIWSVWNKNFRNLNIIYIYFLHLFFNTTWSISFFGLHNLILSLINLIILVLFIVFLIIKFKEISKLSFYLMIPYLVWCCYALILNTTLVYLN